MTGWMLSIDFGTSNTAAAHTNSGSDSVEVVALTHQGNLMPSAVFVESPHSIEVGDVAINRAETNPGAFVASPKRVIGQEVLTVNGYDIPSAVPAAAVLHTVIGAATSMHRGSPPDHLVLTHPEGWSPREIDILLDAAARVGFRGTRVSLVSEPRAAAHYYSRSGAMAPGTRIAVFDFGGGTLDVAVLSATDGSFQVIAARGDNTLGGKSLDAKLRRWVDDQLLDRNPELLEFIRRSAPMHVTRSLEDSIRRAKELLSSTPSASVTVTGNGQQETLYITRDEFDELIAEDVERGVQLTRQALADAGTSTQLSALYLTGGSSRVPQIHERLAALGPIATLDDPKTVVAQGALIAAAHRPHETPPAAARPTIAQSPATQPRPAVSTPPVVRSARKPNIRTMVTATVGAVVVVGAIVAGYLVLGPDSEDSSTAAGSTGVTTTAAAPFASDVDSIRAALPSALDDAVKNCENSDFTDTGGLVARCTLNSPNPLDRYFTDTYGSTHDFTAFVDAKQVKRNLAGVRDYPLAPGDIVIDGAAPNSKIVYGTGYSLTTSTAEYFDPGTGLSAEFTLLATNDEALEFLRTVGLL
ncbi:Hsp70 family protein [Rhodococcus ruber]|uniref:Hsp70 family protein n=1 Tax=Rhodococcus ruber TaxID=1830 RepID=A0ABT4MK47_9NOCA|nr:Hsp70 family protein [Rhodococcus ruber]MCZ4521193.1 Hsp70 family protein [Rhodococcus ruber]